MIQLHNYIMICWEHISMNTMIYQTQKEKKIKRKYKPKVLFLKPYDYDAWLKNVTLTDKEESYDEKSTDLPPMLPLEGDKEKVK